MRKKVRYKQPFEAIQVESDFQNWRHIFAFAGGSYDAELKKSDNGAVHLAFHPWGGGRPLNALEGDWIVKSHANSVQVMGSHYFDQLFEVVD